MSKPTRALDAAIEAAKELPSEAQDAIAKEVMDQVSSYQNSQLTEAQRENLKGRLSREQTIVPRKEVTDLLNRFKNA